MRLTWPLTGRLEEMRLIETAISEPDTSGIIVSGAAGVGKSRIAREALSSAARKKCEERWVIGTSSARTLPLGALASWAGSEGGESVHLVSAVIESLTSATPGMQLDLNDRVKWPVRRLAGVVARFGCRVGEPRGHRRVGERARSWPWCAFGARSVCGRRTAVTVRWF